MFLNLANAEKLLYKSGSNLSFIINGTSMGEILFLVIQILHWFNNSIDILFFKQKNIKKIFSKERKFAGKN